MLSPQNQFYDMPTLFEKIISENAISFPLREYWRIEEYKKANDEVLLEKDIMKFKI